MRTLQPEDSLLPAFYQRLNAHKRGAVALLGELAEQEGVALYLVGGSVRDLLLGRPHLDLDFVVETDAIELAHAFRQQTRAKIVAHEWSRTAVVQTGDFAFDLVTARKEAYPKPGALPVVTPSTIEDDLGRRDFTVNAIALALSGEHKGKLLDPCAGREDLAAGVLRVLHDRSFQDDATRLWRLGRYAAWLGMTPEPETERLAQRDLTYLDTISPARILAELERVLDSTEPEHAVAVLDGLGVLHATHPALRTPGDSGAFSRIRALLPAEPHVAYLCAMAIEANAEEIEGLISRIEPEREMRRALRGLPGLRSAMQHLGIGALPPSKAVSVLERFPNAALTAWAACYNEDGGGEIARRYLTEWRHVRPLLDGKGVQALGVPAGPLVGEALRALRAARLDEKVATLDDEIALVQTEFVNRRGGEG